VVWGCFLLPLLFTAGQAPQLLPADQAGARAELGSVAVVDDNRAADAQIEPAGHDNSSPRAQLGLVSDDKTGARAEIGPLGDDIPGSDAQFGPVGGDNGGVRAQIDPVSDGKPNDGKPGPRAQFGLVGDEKPASRAQFGPVADDTPASRNQFGAAVEAIPPSRAQFGPVSDDKPPTRAQFGAVGDATPASRAQFGPVNVVDDDVLPPPSTKPEVPDKDAKKKKPDPDVKGGGVLLYTMPLTPPNPDQLFRLDSEEMFRERLRTEVRQSSPKTRLEFPDKDRFTAPMPQAVVFWPGYVKWVEPNYVLSKRLFFEQVRFERYGESLGVLQPVVSTGVFGLDVFLWPVRRVAEPFRCYQVNTDGYSPYFQIVGK